MFCSGEEHKIKRENFPYHMNSHVNMSYATNILCSTIIKYNFWRFFCTRTFLVVFASLFFCSSIFRTTSLWKILQVYFWVGKCRKLLYPWWLSPLENMMTRRYKKVHKKTGNYLRVQTCGKQDTVLLLDCVQLDQASSSWTVGEKNKRYTYIILESTNAHH